MLLDELIILIGYTAKIERISNKEEQQRIVAHLMSLTGDLYLLSKCNSITNRGTL